MYLYLAGAMRGIVNLNHPQFNAYADRLRDCGFRVLNPADSPPPNSGANPSRADCLRHDLLVVGVVEGIAVLPNWQNSPGARLEVAAAWAFNIPVYDADTLIHEFVERGNTTAALTMQGFNLRDGLKPFELDAASVVIPRERQYYEGIPLIGLSGFAGVGKDEVARVLVERHDFTRVAFADPLKDVATACGWDGQKDERGRKFLQDLGVGIRDHLNGEAWVLAAEESIEEIQRPIVISDVRFQNEVFMIKRRGGIVVRVERPNTGAVNGHVSEHAVTAADCDAILHNNGTLDDLPIEVAMLLDQFKLNSAPVYAAA